LSIAIPLYGIVYAHHISYRAYNKSANRYKNDGKSRINWATPVLSWEEGTTRS
jgi:hypothetical protein